MGKKEKKTHREPSFGRFVGGYTQCDIEASTASLSYGVIGRVEAKVEGAMELEERVENRRGRGSRRG